MNKLINQKKKDPGAHTSEDIRLSIVKLPMTPRAPGPQSTRIKWSDQHYYWASNLSGSGTSWSALFWFFGCFFFFWLCHVASRILVPAPGIEPRPQQ